MKKNKTLITAFALSFSLVIFLTSCQKVFDYIHQQGNGDAVSDICQVQTISSDGADYGADYVFNYNKRGDLASIITSERTTGNPNVFFIYDKKNRPIQTLSSFTDAVNEPGGYWDWHKYGYNSANQIVKDTGYIFGSVGDDGVISPASQALSIAVIKYDVNNRVVASDDSLWRYGIFSNTDHFAYKYDVRGNLVYTARESRDAQFIYRDTFRVKAYDNKISIRRTNKIWMFIDRNYSVNNALTNATYSPYGLPVFFDSGEYLQGLTVLVPFLTGNVTVQYKCN